MKTNKLYWLVFLSILFIGFYSCTDKGPDIKPTPVNLDLSASSTNPYQALGRVLFYDTHLSVNNAISCASCHKQSMAFSDNVAFSRGFENNLSKRNALPIQNLFNSSTLFWDGRSQNLSQMVLMPILNHVEMGMNDVNSIINKIRNLPYYHDLFVNAFGDSNVDQTRISICLTQFVSAISSGDSRFDQQRAGNNTLSALELQGQDLFNNKYNCSGCHQMQQSFGGFGGGYSFGGPGFVNIGLDQNYADQGLANVSHNATDNGKFKIPSLRNVALTAPYMHDGRFHTLDEVLNHYDHGIVNHPNLDPLLKDITGNPKHFNFSQHEKDAIIAFLNSLTDYNMITSAQYSNPFRVH